MKPAMSHPRVLVVLDDHSQATIVESYAGPDGVEYFTNAVTEIVLGEDAVLDHCKLQHESTEAYHIGATHVVAARSATYSAHSISLGGALVRNDVVTLLGGEGATCTLNGLYLADGERLVDNHTMIDHAMPNCVSRQRYKGILGDEARGVFSGRNIVRAGAQKTSARQINRALLLSHHARMDAKPELEMLAGEASCTQRVAVEQLDADAMSKLRSRGMGDAEARRLLVLAFSRDVLNRLRVPPLRSGVEELLQRRLDRLLGSS
jgi:Fe-S cluster assembly protein SufD